MLDSSRASQLVQKNWQSVGEFAQTLYSIVTSKGPKTVDGPVTIRVEPGKTALRIVQGSQSEAQTPRPPAPRRGRPGLEASGPAAEEGRRLADFSYDEPSSPAPDSKTANVAVLETDRQGFTRISPLEIDISSHSSIPQTRVPGHTQPLDAPTLQAPQSQSEQFATPPARQAGQRIVPASESAPQLGASAGLVELGDITYHDQTLAPSRPVPRPRFPAPGPDRQYTEPHRSPVVSVDGPVSFQGDAPVQFDRPPLLFNPRTKQYEPIADYDLEDLTHIPRGREVYDALVGKVKSGTGKSWTVTIYPYGKPPTSGGGENDTYDVTVQVLNAPDSYKPTKDDWIGPIIEMPNQSGAPDNDYYYFLAGIPGKYALVKAGGISAASGATLGTGNITLCSRNSRVLTADGADDTCLNAGGSISAGVYISIVWVDGAWSTSVAPCS